MECERPIYSTKIGPNDVLKVQRTHGGLWSAWVETDGHCSYTARVGPSPSYAIHRLPVSPTKAWLLEKLLTIQEKLDSLDFVPDEKALQIVFGIGSEPMPETSKDIEDELAKVRADIDAAHKAMGESYEQQKAAIMAELLEAPYEHDPKLKGLDQWLPSIVSRAAESVRHTGIRQDITDRKELAYVLSKCKDFCAEINRVRYETEPDSVWLMIRRRGEPMGSKQLPPKMAEWGEGDLKGWMMDVALPPVIKAWATMQATLDAHMNKMGQL